MIFRGGWKFFCAVMIGWGVAWGAAGELQASNAEVPHRDALIYKDGDRVQGKFIERAGDVIVFRSERFGELRVPATDAVVIMAEKALEPEKLPGAPVVLTPLTVKTEAEAAAAHEAERVRIWEWFSPFVLTAKVRNLFGPWHGRFAFSTEVVSDSAKRSNIALESHVQRKWTSDEIQLTARYDYSETSQVVTTDMVRASGSYRHDFSTALFVLYRPTLEWNRANVRRSAPNDYVLLQQEIGVGFTFLNKPSRKIRAGVAENVFDLWSTAPIQAHASRTVESLFEEVELTLPWRMSVSQRGVWYVPLGGRSDGWENRIELNKKLTETLSVAVRHELRRNNPDGSSQDYTRLRLLLGLDF